MTNIEMIRAYVEKEMRAILNAPDAQVDADGDFAVRKGSTLYWVRTADGDPPLVTVWANLVTGVPRSAKLLRALNDINRDVRQARVFHIDPSGGDPAAGGGRVTMVLDILAETVSRPELERAVRLLAELADQYDDLIKEAFGGQTSFEDDGTEQEETVDV